MASSVNFLKKTFKYCHSKKIHITAQNINKNSHKPTGSCCICLLREAEMAMIPCGHRCICSTCYKKWISGEENCEPRSEMSEILCALLLSYDFTEEYVKDVCYLITSKIYGRCPICRMYVENVLRIYDV